MSPWTWWRCFSGYSNCFLIWWSEVRLSVAIWIRSCHSSNYSCQICSPYGTTGVGYTSTIRWKQVGAAQDGVINTFPKNYFAFLDMAATTRTGPGSPVSYFKCESRNNWNNIIPFMGKGGHFTQGRSVGALSSLHFVCVNFLIFLRIGAVSACLALHMGWLANFLRCQFASAMSQARFLQPCRIVFI